MPPLSSAPPPDPALRWRRLLLCALIGVAVATAAPALEHQWTNTLEQPGPLPESRVIVVPHGTTAQLAEALAADGVIAQPWWFRAAAWVTRDDGALHAAEFAFPAHASLRQVLTVLRTARPIKHHLTIVEGLTAQQIIGVLKHADVMTGEVNTIDEGSVLPQTYDYELDADRVGIVARAKGAMDKALASEWADRAPDVPLSSPRDALILASIVERETAKPEERPHVAAVYLNRLRQGMKLQADPTVVYLASGGVGVLDHPLTKTDLRRDDPFNTYRSSGLPPGPICSPGRDNLRAVLHPAASDDLYFVADGTGGHVFSRSYEAHSVAVARWRALTHGSSD